MRILRRFAWAGAACLTVAAASVAIAQQKDDKDAKEPDKRPKITLRAQPTISMSPSRSSSRPNCLAGRTISKSIYCPSVEWQWGDGTSSEVSSDCEPYEPGKSQIKRRFTVEHLFRAGTYRIVFHLKRHDKAVASATASIQVRPGLRDNGD